MILASGMSPDTEEPLMWAGRVSAFVPTNIPIVGAMLMSTPTPANIIFWQWVNQTYNAGLNYSNRNASSSQTTSDLATAYAMGCVVSIGVAMSLKTAANWALAGKTGFAVAIAGNVINYNAVMLSTNTNVYFIGCS